MGGICEIIMASGREEEQTVVGVCGFITSPGREKEQTSAASSVQWGGSRSNKWAPSAVSL